MPLDIDDIVNALCSRPGIWVRSDTLALELCGDPNKSHLVEGYFDLYPHLFFLTNDAGIIRRAKLRDYAPCPPPPPRDEDQSEIALIAAAVRKYARQCEPYNISIRGIDQGKKVLNRWLHALDIEIDDDDLRITDDTPVEFVSREGGHKNFGYVSGISRDESTLHVSFEHQLNPTDLPGKLKVNRSKVHFSIAEKIESLSQIPQRFPLSNAQCGNAYSNADSADVASHLSIQPQPYTRFLWGPPGSGKTHCIAHFCKNLLNQYGNTRTLIVAPSNVAIDAVVTELITKFSNTRVLSERQIFRYGYPKDPRILNCAEVLGPNEREEMLQRISIVYNEMRQLQREADVQEKLAEKKALLHQLQEELKKATTDHIGEALIVATTIASAFMGNSPIAEIDNWDNVIIDEASMVNGASLLALSSLAQSRCLIVGDPRQLGPIFDWNRRNQPPTADVIKWLSLDPFQLAGLTGGEGWNQNVISNDERLVRVLSQRRCHKIIWSLISNLYEAVEPEVDWAYLNAITQIPPLPGYPAVLLDLSNGRLPVENLLQDRNNVEVEDATNFESACQKKGHTWCNPPTAMLAIDVAREMRATNPNIKIAIITPYRGQVRLIRQWLEEEKKGMAKLQNIDVGTIHSFQGGEADAVIFDIVDGPPRPGLGILLQRESEMRLVNVAVSRAKGKLVIIAHKNWLYDNMHDDQGLLWNILFGTMRSQYRECKVVPPRFDTYESEDLTESPIEKKFYEAIKLRRDIPPITLQYRIFHENGRIISRADFAFPSQKIAIYCDGAQYHLTRNQWQRDLRQRRELVRLGWKYLAFTGAEINSDIENCIEEVVRLLAHEANL